MKIFNAEQIKKLDAYTIKEAGISSLELMESAALTFVDWFLTIFPNTEEEITIFCGSGNNGGDGFAVARLLQQKFYRIRVIHCKIGRSVSADCAANIKRLPKRGDIVIEKLEKGLTYPDVTSGIIIDALLGTGLNRPIEGYWAELINYLNNRPAPIVSIDIPSGLFADGPSKGAIIRASCTMSFEFPKLAFMFPQSQPYVGHWSYESIGLSQRFINKTSSPYQYVDEALVLGYLKQRSKFNHKGTFGHALLIMGSYGKVGAAILSAKAALRSGTGLVTIHAPRCAYQILQMSVPEAMVSIDHHEYAFTEAPQLAPFKAVGIGCGLGTNALSFEGMARLLVNTTVPMVIDADALNIIAQHPALFIEIPANSILTPHPKEFERLFGPTENDFARLHLQMEQAKALNCYIILKGAHTCIACPDGQVYFNSTGNPGMATAGSGDVLTGILTGLMAQGYSSQEAAVLGVFLHGLAGDLAVEGTNSEEALLASDLINQLGTAFHFLHTIRP